MCMEEVTALIPCFNEAPRIKTVLDVLTQSSHIAYVVVVNDGSTDTTKDMLDTYGASSRLTILHLPTNAGKGDAIRLGLTHISTPITFISDADITGLKDDVLEELITPVCTHECDLCVGISDRGGPALRWIRKHILPLLAGERVLKTDILKQIAQNKCFQGWGVELFMNAYARHHSLKIKKVSLIGIKDTLQVQKRGILTYLKRVGTLTSIFLKLRFFYPKDG